MDANCLINHWEKVVAEKKYEINQYNDTTIECLEINLCGRKRLILKVKGRLMIKKICSHCHKEEIHNIEIEKKNYCFNSVLIMLICTHCLKMNKLFINVGEFIDFLKSPYRVREE